MAKTSMPPPAAAAGLDLAGILDSSGIATLVLDREMRLRYFTPAAAALFSFQPHGLGSLLADIPRALIDDRLLPDAETVLLTGVSLWRQVEGTDGGWYNRRLLPHRDAGGSVQGVVITFADSSEMKAAEREIEAARAYSNSIVDTIRQPLVVLDHELRLASASPSFYRSFGILPAGAIGRQLTELNDRCFDVQALRSYLDRLFAGREVSEDYEIEIDLPPRGRKVLQLNASEIPAVPPMKRRVLLAMDDVTNRKRAELALEAAKRQAEHANLGKSRFLAAASHDLRQPLQTLALLQGLLAAEVKDKGTLKLVARIGDSLDAMTGMLNKLLDINQLEAGGVTPSLEIFPLDRLFERLRGDLASQAEAKGLRHAIVGSRQLIESDPTLLEQMIRNLVSNALKYTGRGKIVLGTRRRAGRLRIEVWDSGSGIPEAQHKAIFEEFLQLDNPARDRVRGLGLGLSIVRRLADLLGHAVEVRSVPGKGSVFSIEVPRAEPASVAAPALPGGEATPLPRGRSVLIVDDDPAIRDLLEILFKSAGYRVTIAADGPAALVPGASPPDLVIADYNLPNGLTGLDVATALRERFGSSLPVLIVTGDISTSTLRAIAGAGCVHLNKPVKADELLALVASRLAALPAPAARVAVDDEPTVFLIDDDAGLRETMRELIGREGRRVEAFDSGEAFLAAWRPDVKGCLLVDARLPGLGGLALLQQLHAAGHAPPSIMITGHGEVAMAVEAMKAGAIDFIEKPVRAEELLASIDRALALARDSMALSSWREDAAARIASLTRREREIMDMVIAGHPNKIIAFDLDVSQRTVENHRAAVMRKTHSKSLSDLVRLSIAAV